jgi:cytochrome c-type biogenesis protein
VASNNISLIAAFVAGIASFTSPCILPLVPIYLATIGGLGATLADHNQIDIPLALNRKSRLLKVGNAILKSRFSTMTRNTILFIFGFGLVFTLLGLSTNIISRQIISKQTVITRFSGILIVVMAIFMLATLFVRAPGIYKEWRTHPKINKLGNFAAPVAGAAFAFGWTPCVGPILASILALSSSQGHSGQGAILMATYSLGLGIPFLIVSIFFDSLKAPLTWLKRHGNNVTFVSATLLAILGILLTMDKLSIITSLYDSLI